MGKKKVSYFYDQDIGGFYYGADHPMKPHRIRLTHALVLHCGLANELDMFKIKKATPTDLVKFHSPEYVKFLQKVTPSNRDKMNPQCKQFNVGDDCPIFEGLFDYCTTYAGGSIAGAIKLNYKSSDVVINWAGGLHHAKKGEASGFCYVNDIVLAILELLKYHKRVLYVDIDIHHGDGVEEAFLTTDRVFTVSFHKFGGGFFPGTGDIAHVGRGKGKYYALNIPLNNGIDDESYEFLFKPILDKVVEMYQPEAVVFQSGADSLAGDRLGHFNLSMKGHAACQLHVLNYGLPTLVVGGGGYKISNTARCWAYETGRIVGKDLGDTLPETEYQEYFGTSELQIPVRRDLVNENTREYLEKIRLKAFENLTMLGAVPSTSFQERPPDAMDIDDIVSQQAEAQAPPRLWDDKPREPEDNEPGAKRPRADFSYRTYQDENDISGSPGGLQSTSTSGQERWEKGSEMEGSETDRPSATMASALKPAIPSTGSFAVLTNGKGPAEELSNGKGPAEGGKGDQPMLERPRLEPWPAGATVPPVANS